MTCLNDRCSRSTVGAVVAFRAIVLTATTSPFVLEAVSADGVCQGPRPNGPRGGGRSRRQVDDSWGAGQLDPKKGQLLKTLC